jgi:hypothetical protein
MELREKDRLVLSRIACLDDEDHRVNVEWDEKAVTINACRPPQVFNQIVAEIMVRKVKRLIVRSVGGWLAQGFVSCLSSDGHKNGGDKKRLETQSRRRNDVCMCSVKPVRKSEKRFLRRALTGTQ